MVGIPRGRLGVGGKFISTFIDSMGNAGKIVDADDIDDLDAFVDARVTTTSGEGSKVFVVTASYNASTGVLRFGSFRGGFPSTIAVGDVVVFVSPSNIEDDQDITVDDQVNSPQTAISTTLMALWCRAASLVRAACIGRSGYSRG